MRFLVSTRRSFLAAARPPGAVAAAALAAARPPGAVAAAALAAARPPGEVAAAALAAARPPGAVAAAALALVALLALTGCSDAEGTGDKGFISADGVLRGIDPADRKPPVEYAGEDLDGNALDLADLRGKVAVVNVWASWCEPCNLEMPDLVGAAAETEGEAAFVGVNIRDASQANARTFVRAKDVGYPSFFSPDGKALLAFQGQVPAGAIPTTLVLDKEGRIAAVCNGRIPSKLTLVEVVEDVADDGDLNNSDSGDASG